MTAADVSPEPTRYYVGTAPFILGEELGDAPVRVEVKLPWQSYAAAVCGDPIRGWELVYQCPADQEALAPRTSHAVFAVPVGCIVPVGAFRLLNVTAGIMFAGPDHPVPAVAWYVSP